MRRPACALLVFAWLTYPSDYNDQIQKWRADRETRLKAPDGWLTLTGLSWLQPGDNPVGSDPSSHVVLPKAAPARAGVFRLAGDIVTYRPGSGPAKTLKPDSDDFVPIAGAKLFVIHRGARFGVRIKDNNSEYRRRFTKLDWFPVNPSWRIVARLQKYDKPRTLTFNDQSGGKQTMTIPGTLDFTREGKTFSMLPILEEDQLFLVFRDRTAGKTTYPAARFLYADVPKGANAELDFNKAYNPPCVFTPYATCPLPPPENRLPIAIEAGEKMYRESKDHR